MANIRRKNFKLTEDEQKRFRRLESVPHVAWTLWGEIAFNRGIDYSTIIGINASQFTALPLEHGKEWCWPTPLKMSNPPITWPREK